jgi:hypothetical protein
MFIKGLQSVFKPWNVSNSQLVPLWESTLMRYSRATYIVQLCCREHFTFQSKPHIGDKEIVDLTFDLSAPVKSSWKYDCSK